MCARDPISGSGTCPRDALCDECVEQSVHWRVGVATVRGQLWATRVSLRVARASVPWPAFDGRAAEIAHRHVADLGHDPRLLDRLARACHAGASEWWHRDEDTYGLPDGCPPRSAPLRPGGRSTG